MRLSVDVAALGATRRSLHTAAEHLLAGDLWRSTGRIGLRRTPGGFGQPEHEVNGVRRRLRIDGTSLVVLDGDVERWVPLSTLASVASAADADLAPPLGVYSAETVIEPDAAMDVEPAAAAALADWFALVDEALAEVRRRHTAHTPTMVQLWPEHFDLACSMTEINLGGSPGDGDHDEPYLYVGPWSRRAGSFWNEPWGASVSWSEVTSVDDAVRFLEDGLHRAGADSVVS